MFHFKLAEFHRKHRNNAILRRWFCSISLTPSFHIFTSTKTSLQKSNFAKLWVCLYPFGFDVESNIYFPMGSNGENFLEILNRFTLRLMRKWSWTQLSEGIICYEEKLPREQKSVMQRKSFNSLSIMEFPGAPERFIIAVKDTTITF